jgi:hypothetical protein
MSGALNPRLELSKKRARSPSARQMLTEPAPGPPCPEAIPSLPGRLAGPQRPSLPRMRALSPGGQAGLDRPSPAHRDRDIYRPGGPIRFFCPIESRGRVSVSRERLQITQDKYRPWAVLPNRGRPAKAQGGQGRSRPLGLGCSGRLAGRENCPRFRTVSAKGGGQNCCKLQRFLTLILQIGGTGRAWRAAKLSNSVGGFGPMRGRGFRPGP